MAESLSAAVDLSPVVCQRWQAHERLGSCRFLVFLVSVSGCLRCHCCRSVFIS